MSRQLWYFYLMSNEKEAGHTSLKLMLATNSQERREQALERVFTVVVELLFRQLVKYKWKVFLSWIPTDSPRMRTSSLVHLKVTGIVTPFQARKPEVMLRLILARANYDCLSVFCTTSLIQRPGNTD